MGGGFEIDLPEGTYRLIAAKGPEYTPVDKTITVSPAGNNAVQVELRRWIDMSRRGWHSGDCHIHFARPDKSANEPLRIWTQAEDLRVGNVLRMGDGLGTYFEQYAFGRAGRFVGRGGILVPGQEDPRTNVLGHSMHLNIQQPVHDEKAYYLYGKMFDETHRQGGIAGYAHVYNDLFTVRRDMALNVPRGKVDFAEIAEFGSVKPELYSEFLNLGFRITAVGGSDAPWGGTADADEWYNGVLAGRTFATLGPILEFTVDGHPPGDDLECKPGQRLKIHAKALTGKGAAPIGCLQVIANGEVIREADASGNEAVLDFDLPSERSLWLAARTRDAHTSPLYITVNGRRHWKISDVPRLIAARERDLDEIQKLLENNGETMQTHWTPDRENIDSFRRERAQLDEAVREARRIYQSLRAEAGVAASH